MRGISSNTRSCGSADTCVPSLFLAPDYAASLIRTSRTIHVLQGLGYAVTQTDGDNAMTHAEPAGLMAFWADIDPDYEMRFLEWHNCEHMPERVSVPGFREGRRYRSIGDAPRYLMMYLTESADVLSSDGYMERLNDPTPWTRESLGHFRRPSRNVYTLLSTCGDTSLRESPYLVSIRFDIAPEAGNRIRSSIRNELLPGWAALPQAGRAQFYGIDTVVSGIETAERGIYEGGPGSQRFLLLAECAQSGAIDSEDWQALWINLDESMTGGSPPITHVIRETFRIDYMLPAP